jgi:predicted nucleic acid-binding protein
MEPRQRFVKAFFDTSVLLAALSEENRDHEASLTAFLSTEKGQGFCGGHSLAEFYSVATRFPAKSRLSADQVLLFFESIRERLTIITLTAEEYFDTVIQAAEKGIVGGLIYDMLLARCAVKAGADILYTINVKHFAQLGPDISRRLKSP